METDTLLIHNMTAPDSRYNTVHSSLHHERNRSGISNDSSSDEELLDLTLDDHFSHTSVSHRHEGDLAFLFMSEHAFKKMMIYIDCIFFSKLG